MSQMSFIDEFPDRLAQHHYDTANPLERWFINRFRRQDGLPPLRSTWSKRRAEARARKAARAR